MYKNKPKKDSYESGIAQITKSRFNNLNVVWDCSGDDMDNLKERIIVFNFTPDIQNTDIHYHIDLNYKEVRKLQKFLNEYVEEVYMFHE